jgi:hypothetical protein
MKKKKKFMELFREFKDVFSWSYEDLRGFDPNVIQHAIPIKEEAKPVRQRTKTYQSFLRSNNKKGS